MNRIQSNSNKPIITVAVSLVILITQLSSARNKSNLIAQPQAARLILIIVMDGLRPDSINAQDTPTLFRLRQEGVTYLNSHSVFPTVTRVNAAAISTGTYPQSNGLVSNSMFVPSVNPSRAFNTSEHLELLKLRDTSGGRMLFARSMAERLHERGMKFVAVSSGSTGSALLLNPRAPEGIGVLINGNFEPGRRVAYPDDVNATILSRFGAAPKEENSVAVDWADRVLRDYVLKELHPDVLIDWQTEPDGSEHRTGTGSAETRKALANNDRNLALTLEKLRELGLADKTDVIVLSDHGFSRHDFRTNATRGLVQAGLKTSNDSNDVVLASNGQSVLVHVAGHDRQRISRIVEFLKAQDWVETIFTAAPKPSNSPRDAAKTNSDELGWVPGTFSLELIKEANAERGPDILFTLRWSSAANEFGVSGSHYADGDGEPRELTGSASGHGGLSPWLVRNTLVLWGPDFKKGVTLRTPAANVDIAPTVLLLKGVTFGGSLDGRALTEAMRGGPDEEQVISETRVLTTGSGNYRTAIQITELGKRRYIDKAWRIR